MQAEIPRDSAGSKLTTKPPLECRAELSRAGYCWCCYTKLSEELREIPFPQSVLTSDTICLNLLFFKWTFIPVKQLLAITSLVASEGPGWFIVCGPLGGRVIDKYTIFSWSLWGLWGREDTLTLCGTQKPTLKQGPVSLKCRKDTLMCIVKIHLDIEKQLSQESCYNQGCTW